MPQVLDWQVGDEYLTDNGRTVKIVGVARGEEANKIIATGILGELVEFDLQGDALPSADVCKIGNLKSRLTGRIL